MKIIGTGKILPRTRPHTSNVYRTRTRTDVRERILPRTNRNLNISNITPKKLKEISVHHRVNDLLI